MRFGPLGFRQTPVLIPFPRKNLMETGQTSLDGTCCFRVHGFSYHTSSFSESFFVGENGIEGMEWMDVVFLYTIVIVITPN